MCTWDRSAFALGTPRFARHSRAAAAASSRWFSREPGGGGAHVEHIDDLAICQTLGTCNHRKWVNCHHVEHPSRAQASKPTCAALGELLGKPMWLGDREQPFGALTQVSGASASTSAFEPPKKAMLILVCLVKLQVRIFKFWHQARLGATPSTGVNHFRA